MNIAAGQRVAWPADSFSAERSDLLASMDGVALFRIPADLALPGIPTATVQRLGLALLATQDNCINRQPATDTTQGMLWLQQKLQGQESNDLGTDNNKTKISLIDLLDAVHQRRILSSKIRVDSHRPLSSATATDLFLTLEQIHHVEETGEDNSDTNQGLLRCIAAIQGINMHSVVDLKHGPSDPRRRLQLLLEQNSLIGREVLMNEDSLDRNCGDLIAFAEDDSAAPAYLKSTPSGYQIWAPLSMRQPRSIWDCRDLLGQLSPRMVAVSPALAKEDLSTVGLLQFAFGKPNNLTRYIISGLLVGLAMGFLLSIGRDVGASRWIFSLGATGTVLGACLGLVSGGITRVALEWIQSRDVLLTQHTGAAKTQLAGMHRLLRLPTEFFRVRSIGDLQLRFGALEELRLEIQTLVEGGLVRFVLTSTYVLFMLRISVKLTLLAIAVSLLIVVPTTILALQSRPLQRHQEEAEAEAQSRNLELINSVSKLRIAGAEAPAAQWWAERYQQVVKLENSLDIKEATAALLQNIVPNLGTLMIYIMITRLLTEAASSTIMNAPNIGQQLGFFAAFNTFIGGIARLAVVSQHVDQQRSSSSRG